MDLLFIAPQTEGGEGTVVDNPTPTPEQANSESAANNTNTDEGANTGDAITLDDKGSNNNSNAQQTAPPQGGGAGFWIMIGAMILIMYFFMWRPEKKRRKQMEQFRQGIKKGDHVITAGGIYGTVKEVNETSILIESEGNTTLRIDKNMVVGDPSNGTAR